MAQRTWRLGDKAASIEAYHKTRNLGVRGVGLETGTYELGARDKSP